MNKILYTITFMFAIGIVVATLGTLYRITFVTDEVIIYENIFLVKLVEFIGGIISLFGLIFLLCKEVKTWND